MPATPLTFIQSRVKPCQHCGEHFACRAMHDTPCDCFTVQISDETREHIASLGYADCLCNACLNHFEEQVRQGALVEVHN
ncbi:MAG: cysteine-rich CWC family protein [Bacteroidetes bacterium]|nr:cysteine-rich CWC family protein [Bacteroidota bacterium]